LTRYSEDQTSKEIAIKQSCNCPSGRLVTWDKKTGIANEPDLEQSISLVQDPSIDVS